MTRLPVFIILYLITTPLLAMEPPWCDRSRLNRAEHFICDEPSLWEVDKRLGNVLSQVRKSLSGSEKRRLQREQTQWLKQRNSQCIYSVENCSQVCERRIDYLKSLLNENGNDVKCQLYNVPVKSYKTVATSEFNRSVSRAASKGEAWVKDALLVALKFIGHPYEAPPECQLISRENESNPSPSKSIIIVTEEGLWDDSVRGEKYKLELKKDTKGVWQVSKAGIAWRCLRGRGLNDFSAKLCP